MSRARAVLLLIVGCQCRPDAPLPPDPEPTLPAAATAILTQAQAVDVTQQVIAEFEQDAAVHGATLVLDTEDISVDIKSFVTSIKRGRRWALVPRGGFIRAGTTADAWLLISCHEIGHLFGGFPFKQTFTRAELEPYATIAAAEGQADYYATRACAPRMWLDEPETNARYATFIPRQTREGCDASWPDPQRAAVCYRSAHAAMAVLSVLGHPSASPATPEQEVVEQTRNNIRTPQCRLDTFLAGAVCTVEQPTSVIPGVDEPRGGRYGAHNVRSEAAARPYACHGDDPGARPLCWFKPDMPEADLTNPKLCADFQEHCDGNTLVTCDDQTGAVRFPCDAEQNGVPIERCVERWDEDFELTIADCEFISSPEP